MFQKGNESRVQGERKEAQTSLLLALSWKLVAKSALLSRSLLPFHFNRMQSSPCSASGGLAALGGGLVLPEAGLSQRQWGRPGAGWGGGRAWSGGWGWGSGLWASPVPFPSIQDNGLPARVGDDERPGGVGGIIASRASGPPHPVPSWKGGLRAVPGHRGPCPDARGQPLKVRVCLLPSLPSASHVKGTQVQDLPVSSEALSACGLVAGPPGEARGVELGRIDRFVWMEKNLKFLNKVSID